MGNRTRMKFQKEKKYTISVTLTGTTLEKINTIAKKFFGNNRSALSEFLLTTSLEMLYKQGVFTNDE
jgi:hypothetical protein